MKRRIARKRAKSEHKRLESFLRNRMPVLMDCSEVYGDGYYDKELKEKLEKEVQKLKDSLADRLKKIDEEYGYVPHVPSSEPNDEVSDTTGDAQGTEAGKQ